MDQPPSEVATPPLDAPTHVSSCWSRHDMTWQPRHAILLSRVASWLYIAGLWAQPLPTARLLTCSMMQDRIVRKSMTAVPQMHIVAS